MDTYEGHTDVALVSVIRTLGGWTIWILAIAASSYFLGRYCYDLGRQHALAEFHARNARR
jgi:hypothetical protein